MFKSRYQKNRLAYRKRTEIAVELVKQIEAEGQFLLANYAFDNGVLNLALTEVIEQSGKHWVSEIEKIAISIGKETGKELMKYEKS